VRTALRRGRRRGAGGSARGQLEHVPDLDGRGDMRETEVVASAAVNADGDPDHARIVAPEDGRRLVA
jgi:hypothetical protein